MIKSKNVQIIECDDWDELVKKTYEKSYCFQQQDDCQPRGIVRLTIPSTYTNDEDMHDSIPYKINGDQMGVKFKVWLERDPKDGKSIFWERNFYPDIYKLANDLHEKGLIEAGEYLINIDW